MTIDETFALHITWTCYGTWLPGDERGHVSNILSPEGGFQPKQNIPGTPVSKGDLYTRENARRLLKHEPVYLTRDQALVVCSSLAEAVRERSWLIPRAAVMANHVHVVVMNCPDDGPSVRRVLKGVSQATLCAKFGSQHWWTKGGSDRYKHGTLAIETAIHYVEQQEHKLAEIVDMEVRACIL